MNKLTREEALRRWKSAKATKKAIVLLTDIIVWNTQYQHITESILYSKHTIIEQQTGECLRKSLWT